MLLPTVMWMSVSMVSVLVSVPAVVAAAVPVAAVVAVIAMPSRRHLEKHGLKRSMAAR